MLGETSLGFLLNYYTGSESGFTFGVCQGVCLADFFSVSRDWERTFEGRVRQGLRELSARLGREVGEGELARQINASPAAMTKWLKGSLPRRLVLIGITFVIVGCAPVPPAPPAPRTSMPVSASFGKTWSAVIDVFATKNIPIKTIERASGLIATDPLNVPVQTNRKAPHPWADCGKFMGVFDSPSLATYNVRVKGDSSSSTVQINVLWKQSPTTTPFGVQPGEDCSTKGVWETETETEIKARAEGK